jgi:hypothetical protein
MAAQALAVDLKASPAAMDVVGVVSRYSFLHPVMASDAARATNNILLFFIFVLV